VPGGLKCSVAFTGDALVATALPARDIRAFGDYRGLVTLAAGLAGRTELSIELRQWQDGGHGQGRSLLTEALTVVPDGPPVLPAVSTGNARSVRALLATGFAPIGAEVILQPDRRPA
jgi:hypothetical protein